MENKLTVKTETLIRTVILALATFNGIMEMVGKPILPIPDEAIRMAISSVTEIVAILWAWWKNNSFTQHAIEADEYLYSLKQGTSDVMENNNE